MKKNITISILLILALSIGLAEEKFPIDNPDLSMAGFTIFQTNYGAGLGGFYEKNFTPSDKIGFNMKFIVTRGEGDYPQRYYDPITRRTYTFQRADKRRLYLLETYIHYKRLFFTDQIANNFRPFVEVNMGPVIGLDPPNRSDYSIWKRWKRMDLPFTLGGNINVGFDYVWKGSRYFSLSIGYDFIKFRKNIDPPPDFGKDYQPPYQSKSNFNSMLGMVKIGWIL